MDARARLGSIPATRMRAAVAPSAKAPAFASVPSMPSVSATRQDTPLSPSIARASASRNSAFQPPRPDPRTVTVVSLRESSRTGRENGRMRIRSCAQSWPKSEPRLAAPLRCNRKEYAQGLPVRRQVGRQLPARAPRMLQRSPCFLQIEDPPVGEAHFPDWQEAPRPIWADATHIHAQAREPWHVNPGWERSGRMPPKQDHPLAHSRSPAWQRVQVKPKRPNASFYCAEFIADLVHPGEPLRQGALRAHGAMADGGDDALNRIGRAQGVPVRGGDVEERQQSPGVFGQAGDGGCRSGPVCFP